MHIRQFGCTLHASQATFEHDRFTGVRSLCGKWKAYIIIGQEEVTLGSYHQEDTAARACDKARIYQVS